MGVQMPLVNTREEAQRVVDSVKYPPVGKRGLAAVRAARWGLAMPLAEYVRMANAETLVVIQAETVQALEKIGELCSVDGVDVVFMGPSDISSSLGLHGQTRHPQVIERIVQAGKAIHKAGKAAGTICRDLDDYKLWRQNGFQYLCTSASAFLASSATAYVKALREYEKGLPPVR